MSIEHYENFPVATVLCPPALRPAVVAIYRFARTADDLADEGDAPSVQRLEDLRAFRAELHAVAGGAHPGPRWQTVFAPLQRQIAERALPVALLDALLTAFEQDVVQQRYTDRQELLRYCEHSANPVGRLMLHLYGISDSASLTQSDHICTALQLANFWQDLSVDTTRGRLYIPLADCERFGVAPQALLARQDSPAARAVVTEMVHWTRTLMHAGSELVHAVPGRAGWELRLVVQGGLRILDRVEALRHTSLNTRPTLGWTDVVTMAWRALRMRPAPARHLQKARP
jgi:squalene synthase HpnC